MPKEDPEWAGFLQATFLSVLESADEGLVVFDADGRCRMIGRRAGEIFGVEPAAYVGRMRDEVLAALAQACEEPEALLEVAESLSLPGGPNSMVEVDVRRPRPRTVMCKGVLILLRDVRPPGWLILVSDVTRERAAERANKQLQARIVELTAYDPLTGLLNMRRFHEELEREHGRSTRAWDSYAIVRLDVDGMGSINDEFGRPVGDQVLERIAGLLKTCLREYDVLARLEGDEFGILLPGADELAARAVGKRIYRTLSVEELSLGSTRRVTLSMGCALWVPPSGELASHILQRAGNATVEARAGEAGLLYVDPAQPGSA
jgi:diguanylate cyclase (GGDEF)-like protein/PAS domain S-box-containing protein